MILILGVGLPVLLAVLVLARIVCTRKRAVLDPPDLSVVHRLETVTERFEEIAIRIESSMGDE